MTRAAARGVRLARVRRAAARPQRRSTSTRSTRNTSTPRSPQSRRVLPLHKRGNRLFVATSDPANLQALEEVRFKTNLIVEPVVVEDDKLGAGDPQADRGQRRDAAGAWRQPRGHRGRLLEDGGQPASGDEDSRGRGRAGRQATSRRSCSTRSAAGASDIHFEPYEKFYRIRYRIDGVLMEVAQPPLAIKDKVASRIKVISKLDISGEARAAGRPHEARAVEDASRSTSASSTLPDAVRREDRDADPRLGSGVKLGIEALGLRGRTSRSCCCTRSAGRTG